MIKWAIEKYNHSLSQIHSVLQDLILWIQSWSSLLNTALKILLHNNNKISRNTAMRNRHENTENQWHTFDTLIFLLDFITDLMDIMWLQVKKGSPDPI